MKHFDIVNPEDQIIGSATSVECHSNPKLIHRVAHFTLVDGLQQKILMTQRSPNVKFDSGMWCFPGEHLLQGDDYPTAVFRGINDELGFECRGGIGEKCHTIFSQPNQTEFARFFIGYYRDEKISPNPAEIFQIQWVTLDELKRNKQQCSSMTQYWIEHADWNEILKFSHSLSMNTDLSVLK